MEVDNRLPTPVKASRTSLLIYGIIYQKQILNSNTMASLRNQYEQYVAVSKLVFVELG